MMKLHGHSRRCLLGIAVLLVSLVTAAFVLRWTYDFFPSYRVEIGADGRRVFTHKVGFVDLGIHLEAADWPYTWRRPVFLGDLYWPEIYSDRRVYWSVDQSVIAIQTGRVDAPGLLVFSDAYDFREHRVIRPAMDGEIRELMSARGGLGERVTDLDDGKGDLYGGFPGWGWIAPGVILGMGGIVAWRIGRGMG